MERESGILFQGDGRALLAQDLNDDCRPDLIASFNSGKPMTLVNRSRPRCSSLPENIGRSRKPSRSRFALELALPQWPAKVLPIKLGKFVSFFPRTPSLSCSNRGQPDRERNDSFPLGSEINSFSQRILRHREDTGSHPLRVCHSPKFRYSRAFE